MKKILMIDSAGVGYPSIRFSLGTLKSLLEKYGYRCKIITIDKMTSSHIHNFGIVVTVNCMFRKILPGTTYITWMQDNVGSMMHDAQRDRFNNNPNCRAIGYTDTLKLAGYFPDRLIYMQYLVDRDIFENVQTGPDRDKKIFDLVFVSNKGDSLDNIIYSICKNILFKAMPRLNMGMFVRRCLDLYDSYINGMPPLNTFNAIENYFCVVPEFLAEYNPLPFEIKQGLVNTWLKWWINEPIYRQATLKWMKDENLKMQLAGNGWQNNPEFKQYASGIIFPHAVPLLYRKSEYCLHLNHQEGSYHQRIFEILAAGGRVLMKGPALRKAEKKFDAKEFFDHQENYVKQIFEAIEKKEKPVKASLYSPTGYVNVFSNRNDLKEFFTTSTVSTASTASTVKER